MKNQANTITTQHTINYCGYVVKIEGKHKLMYAQNSKMYFTFWLSLSDGGRRGMEFHNNPSSKNFKLSLKEKLDKAIKDHEQFEKYNNEHNIWKQQFLNLTNFEKISHKDFAYSRICNAFGKKTYNFYAKSKFSPSGVENIGGCSDIEWNQISKIAGKQNQYLAPNERW